MAEVSNMTYFYYIYNSFPYIDLFIFQASTSYQSTTQHQILKCFCGCKNLTFDEVKRIAHMNVTNLIENENSKNLFKSFLKIGHLSDKSKAMVELECYELCKLLCNNPSHRTEENIDNICDVCPNYKWECDLREKFDNWSENEEDFEKFLKTLMNQNKREIEAHSDYKRFHAELLKKLGNCNVLNKQKS